MTATIEALRATDTRMLDRELVLENQWLKERVKTLQAEVKQAHENIAELAADNKLMERFLNK